MYDRTAATAARVARTERLRLDPTLAPHGITSTYSNWGCRCALCTQANAEKSAAYDGRSVQYGPHLKEVPVPPGQKRCSQCRLTLPLDAFRRRTSASVRKRSECRDCRRANELTRPRRDERGRGLRRLYRRDIAWYNETLAEQDGACALCGSTEPRSKAGVFEVDHDHRCCPSHITCGTCIRGLLCRNCNCKLGWFENRRELILAYCEARK